MISWYFDSFPFVQVIARLGGAGGDALQLSVLRIGFMGIFRFCDYMVLSC